MTFRDLTAFSPFSREKILWFWDILIKEYIKAYLWPNIINFNNVDFSERRPEEVMSFFWRSVFLQRSSMAVFTCTHHLNSQQSTLGSFRLQSTCRYQRSREDVCPQHKATGHVSKYVNSRCAIENCLMSARNIRATAHAPCSQHTFNRNLELKTDQFHGVYRLVTPST